MGSMSWTEDTMKTARRICANIPDEGEEFSISTSEMPFWTPAKVYLDGALDEIQRLHKEANKEADERVLTDLRAWLEDLAADHTRFEGEIGLFLLMLERFEADRKLKKWTDEREAKSWL